MLRPIKMTFQKFQRAIDRIRWRKINLRAASALLIFLLGWSALPATMLAQVPDTCSMECCIAEGHCCCATVKPFVEGQDYGDVQKIGQLEAAPSCQNLATLPSGAKVFPRLTTPVVTHLPAPDDHAQLSHRRGESFYLSPQFSPDSSRAPPALLINS